MVDTPPAPKSSEAPAAAAPAAQTRKPAPLPPPDPLAALLRGIRQRRFDAAEDVKAAKAKMPSRLRNNGRDYVGYHALDVQFLEDVVGLFDLAFLPEGSAVLPENLELLRRFNRNVEPANAAAERDRMVAVIRQEYRHGTAAVPAAISPGGEPTPEAAEEARPSSREARTAMAPKK